MTNLTKVLALILTGLTGLALSFTPPPNMALSRPKTTNIYLFGPPKDDGSPGDYLCLDCGYVFTKGPKAWAALPDNYSCPPCGAM